MPKLPLANPYVVLWSFGTWDDTADENFAKWCKANITGKVYSYGPNTGNATLTNIAAFAGKEAATESPNEPAPGTILMLFENAQDALLFKLSFETN
jgi:hypothetical protein